MCCRKLPMDCAWTASASRLFQIAVELGTNEAWKALVLAASASRLFQIAVELGTNEAWKALVLAASASRLFQIAGYK